MYSLSIDYLFNRIYDVLLWIKYVWLFVLLRKSPDDYLALHANREFDGLRDRGWFSNYLEQKDAAVPLADVHTSLWQTFLDKTGIKLRDSDGDGVPDVSDATPFDPENLTEVQLRERYESDYTTWDHVRDALGLGPTDNDKDGVPDSYERAHNMDPNLADSDRDGISDNQELLRGTDPLNNDTDGDLVLDGRDEAPLDPTVSSLGVDTDGDGVSDKIEVFLGTDPTKKDTDMDGILDNMDTYPLDHENISRLASFDLDKTTHGIHFAIQNPVLSLFTDLLSILAILVLVFLVYIFLRWLLGFRESLDHYEHHFKHGDHHNDRGIHTISHADEELPAGIAHLPVHHDAPALPPEPKEFEDHPRFAIIQGYMSSTSEALWRIGLLEADNMLAEVLKEKGYQGETVGDMLKEASFKTVRLAWDAHMIRNRIAHEGSLFELTEREAKRAFTLYESVFRELKVIR